MNRPKRAWTIGVSCLGLLLIAFLLKNHESGSTQRLSNGSRLCLQQVKVGNTNKFMEGTPLEKFLAPLVPANGMRFRRWTLQQPGERVFPHPCDWVAGLHSGRALSPVTGLTAQFRLYAPLRTAGLHRRFRWVINGGDEMRYVEECWGLDCDYAYLDTTVFPRCARRLTILLEERESENAGSWKEAARFGVDNAVVPLPRPWPRPTSPETKRFEEMEFTLEKPEFLSQPANPHGIWACDVRLPFRISCHAITQTNWSAERMVIEDSSGNICYISPTKSVTNQWVVYRAGRSVDPRLPWLIAVDFGIDSDWPSTNLFSLEMDPASASAIATVTNSNGSLMRVRSLLVTNFSAVPVTTYTDPVGQVVVNIPTNRTDLRLKYVRATDAEGRSVGDEGGSWSQHEFSRSLDPSALSRPGGRIQITFAISRNYHMEFCCQPSVLERQVETAKPTSSSGKSRAP
jgi:hypothetical protein